MTLNLSHVCKLSAALVLGVCLSGVALAQAADPHAGHAMAGMSMDMGSAAAPSSAAFE